jgi:hypothetical protein
LFADEVIGFTAGVGHRGGSKKVNRFDSYQYISFW